MGATYTRRLRSAPAFPEHHDYRTTMSHATMTEPKSSRAASTDTGAILVSGAGGEMGHALLEAFAQRYHGNREIIAMDVRELPKERAAHATKAYACDVSDAAAIDELLSLIHI
jgi:FlaA1/EpsC-like NDP-sugar epimerase